jgi:ribonucleoside-diphosphate reductase alpha chain
LDYFQRYLQHPQPQDHVGVIHSSNLCTEITLNTGADETAVCNLGSVVLDSHLKSDGSIDHDKLRDTIRTAVRALDNVIDVNFYPTEAAKTSNMRHRPIGMGVMGLQNSLFRRIFHSLRRKQSSLTMNLWRPSVIMLTKLQVI